MKPPVGLPQIELLGKPGCHLCEEAKAVVAEVCQPRNVPWKEVNIEDQPDTYAAYLEEIPVLLINGRKAFKYHIDKKALQRALSRFLA